MKSHWYILILLFFIIEIAKGSTADSVQKVYDSKSVRFVYLKNVKSDTLAFNPLDTTSLWFQNFNPIYKDNIPRMYLGNLGLASKSFLVDESTGVGFNYGRNSFDIYLKKLDDLKFYRVFSPHTSLSYVWNRRKEQLFDFTFAQNLGPRFNYAVNFRRLVSLGDYNRQKSDHLNWDANVWYTSRNRRYQIMAATFVNSLLIQENGGVQNDSIFITRSRVNSEVEPVNLLGAANSLSDRNAFVRQSFAFGRRDTIRLDSLTYTRIQPKWRLSHEFLYTERIDKYSESPRDTNLYQDVFFDSSNTADRIKYVMVQNSIGLEHYLRRSFQGRASSVSLYMRHQNVRVQNLNLIEDRFQSLRLDAMAKLQIASKQEAVLQVNSIIAERYAGNTNLVFQLNQYLSNNEQKISLQAAYNQSAASYFYSRYSSNHFQRNTNLLDLQEFNAGLMYQQHKYHLKFGVKYIQRSNHAYLDQNLQVQQLSNFNYFQFQIATIFNAGNFYFSNVSYLQYSDASAIIRLPLLHTYESIYFQRHLFKKALFLRTGFDVRYYTSMEAYRYDPANAEFFLGNTTIGDFPIFDYFVTLSLKRAVLLLKVEHLNQGVGRLGNNMVPGYPLLDRSVKIGFKWAFYD